MHGKIGFSHKIPFISHFFYLITISIAKLAYLWRALPIFREASFSYKQFFGNRLVVFSYLNLKQVKQKPEVKFMTDF
jgi:hypothetical protein